MKKLSLLLFVCLIFGSISSVFAQSRAPKTPKQSETIPLRTSSDEFNGVPVDYTTDQDVSSGSGDYTWTVTQHIHGLWRIFSKESVAASQVIDNITHLESWIEGTYIGEYSEVSTIGFGPVGGKRATVGITGKLSVTLWSVPVSHTYSNSRTFVIPPR